MGYIDVAIAVSIFLVLISIIIVRSVSFFSDLPNIFKISEYRNKAIRLFNSFFESKGNPKNWEEVDSIPTKLGLISDLYRTPVLVEETGGLNRTDEPITIQITFDEYCENKTWNNTIRIYDETNSITPYELSDTNFCYEQYLDYANITWKLNISANEKKKFWIYYSPDDTITDPNYGQLTIDTTSWIPNDGDSWTESTNNWSRYGGETGDIVLDIVNKKVGDKSVNITGTFNTTSLGLEYNPPNSIDGVSNGWYLRVWVYIDDTQNLKSINISVKDTTEIIHMNILDDMDSDTWYLFEKELSSSAGWEGWNTFNASNGIDFIRFYANNATTGLTRTLKVDGLRFEKKPLDVTTFPEENITAISRSKIDALKDMSYDELKEALGEDYKFRIEIIEGE